MDLRAAIASRGIVLTDVAELGGALGVSVGGRIQIIKGLPPAEEFVVLVHEVAHLCSAIGYLQLDRRRSIAAAPS